MAKKFDHYIAFPDKDVDKAYLWDMLRYDACYPVSNAPDGWIVLKQPAVKDVKGGFTLDRWRSFGIRNPIVAESDLNAGLPFFILDQISRRRQTAGAV